MDTPADCAITACSSSWSVYAAIQHYNERSYCEAFSSHRNGCAAVWYRFRPLTDHLSSSVHGHQQVDMHSHVSHSTSLSQGGSAADAQGGGLLDSLSDTLLNAFSRVRKPDEKFEGMRERLERLEEGLGGTERVILRSRARHGGEYYSEPTRKRSVPSTHIADALQRLPPLAPFPLRKIPTLLIETPLLLLLSRLLFMHLNFLRQIWEPNLKIWPPITKTSLTPSRVLAFSRVALPSHSIALLPQAWNGLDYSAIM